MEITRKRIGLISIECPKDKRVSSGTLYTITKSLESIGDTEWVRLRKSKIYRSLELLSKIIAKCSNKNICFSHTNIASGLLSKSISKCDFRKYDILVAFWCGQLIGKIEFDGVPVIYLSDATFPAMIDYYPPFSKLWSWNIKQGIALEKKSMNNASVIVLSSDWAAKSAINDLEQPKEKIRVVEFGANISESEINLYQSEDYKDKNTLHLLFLGVEWERKGGDIAVETVKWLNGRGVPTILHIIGVKKLDEEISRLPYINYIGFLNKNDSRQYRILSKELASCNALILPTKAECSAIAFAEASAYGIPTFTYETGGISNYIENGMNGYMLPIGSTAADFGSVILKCFNDGSLSHMSKNARTIYEHKLNWNVWTAKMTEIIESLS